MKAAKQILSAHGIETVEDMDMGEVYEAEASIGMDLVIEKIGENRVSVGHYYKQRGDLISDPEIVFNVSNGEWTPVRYTQHPGIHKHDEDGLEGVANFVETWSKNIQKQGYTAKENEEAEA